MSSWPLAPPLAPFPLLPWPERRVSMILIGAAFPLLGPHPLSLFPARTPRGCSVCPPFSPPPSGGRRPIRARLPARARGARAHRSPSATATPSRGQKTVPGDTFDPSLRGLSVFGRGTCPLPSALRIFADPPKRRSRSPPRPSFRAPHPSSQAPGLASKDLVGESPKACPIKRHRRRRVHHRDGASLRGRGGGDDSPLIYM
jgi:hypothetical protein